MECYVKKFLTAAALVVAAADASAQPVELNDEEVRITCLRYMAISVDYATALYNGMRHDEIVAILAERFLQKGDTKGYELGVAVLRDVLATQARTSNPSETGSYLQQMCLSARGQNIIAYMDVDDIRRTAARD